MINYSVELAIAIDIATSNSGGKATLRSKFGANEQLFSFPLDGNVTTKGLLEVAVSPFVVTVAFQSCTSGTVTLS